MQPKEDAEVEQWRLTFFVVHSTNYTSFIILITESSTTDKKNL